MKLITKEVCRFAVMHECQAFILLVKKGVIDRKIPLLWPPLLLKSASCLFELPPGVEKSRIRGNI